MRDLQKAMCDCAAVFLNFGEMSSELLMGNQQYGIGVSRPCISRRSDRSPFGCSRGRSNISATKIGTLP